MSARKEHLSNQFEGEVNLPNELVACFLVGRFTPEQIVEEGFANDNASVNNLLQVGTEIGQFFNLLDENNDSTEFFDIFFELENN